MSAPNLRTSGKLAIGAIAILAAFLQGLSLYKNRGRYAAPDFDHYYADSVRLRSGGNPWRIGSHETDGSHDVQMAFNYPPAFYLMFSPLTRIRQWPAYWIWLGIQVVAFGSAMILVLEEVRPRAGPWLATLVVGAAFLFPQGFGSFYDSQPTALLLLMLVAAWRCGRRGRDLIAGLLLAAAALVKIYPAFVGGYFLFRGRLKIAAYAIGFAIAGQCALIGLYGLDRNLDFFAAARMAMVPGWADLDRNISIASNLHFGLLKLYGGTDLSGGARALHAALSALSYLATLAAAGLLTIRAAGATATIDRAAEPILDGLLWSLWMVVAMLLSPLAWAHYLLLIVPMYLLIWVQAASIHRDGDAIVAAPGLVLIGIGFAGFVVPYFSGPVRAMHTYFIALILTFIGVCALITRWSGAREEPS